MANKKSKKSTTKRANKNIKTATKKNKVKKFNKLYILLALGSVLLLAAGGWILRSAGQPYYIGMNRCTSCHKKEFEKMKKNQSMAKMMTAIDRLQGEDRDTPRCLGCHTTGYGKKWDKSIPFAERVSVQCEACHGPGSKYIKIMENGYSKNNKSLRRQAIKAGLIISPKKDTCFQCHHDGDIGPDGQPIIWDFEQHRSQILH